MLDKLLVLDMYPTSESSIAISESSIAMDDLLVATDH